MLAGIKGIPNLNPLHNLTDKSTSALDLISEYLGSNNTSSNDIFSLKGIKFSAWPWLFFGIPTWDIPEKRRLSTIINGEVV